LTANDICFFAAAALFRHMACFFSAHAQTPSRRWLHVNYGSLAVASAAAIALAETIHGGKPCTSQDLWGIFYWLYVFTMVGLGTRHIVPLANGPWRPGGLLAARRPDIAFLAFALVFMAVMVGLSFFGGWATHRDLLSFVATLLSVAISLPFAVRILGAVVRGVLLSLFLIAAAGLIALGALQLDARFADAGLRPALMLLTALAVALVFGPGLTWLQGALDRLLFRRRRNRHAELQARLQRLSPELGIDACCKRSLEALRHALQLRGAALIRSDGGAAVEGEFRLDLLEKSWPRGAAADLLIAQPMGYELLWRLPVEVREGLVAAEVVAILPVRGAHRLWGHLLLTTDLFGTTFSDDDAQALDAFAAQVGLLLDGAELLTRVVAVERSLAHSEKLAAIGELAARVAHEIRNPVTAARSLAQLIAREPNSPLNPESAQIILSELERVERQVAALLRFARRDEFHFEPVDVGGLVRETMDALSTSLDSAHVDLELSAPEGIVARADREKLRQVVINLVENAVDALETMSQPGPARHLAVAVAQTDGRAVVRVADSGPGVPANARDQIFEPFFSLKHTGTGLGLAIVKRTLEAHGGDIAIESANGSGLALRIELPLSVNGPAAPPC
jgi:signal transduction histidine kinase